MRENLPKKSLLGVHVTDASEKEVLEYVLARLKSPSKKLYIVTPNPEMLVYAQAHISFKFILNNAEIALPDGIGLLWASRLLGGGLQERITGVDLMDKICKKVAEQTVNIGLMGGRKGIAELAANRLKKKYPGLNINYIAEEWNEENVKLNKIDILFVAYGFPKQEKWISENLDKIPVTVAMGVGGAFDFISGQVPRAPRILQRVGLEWLFRLLIQPWRFKRQLSLLSFLFLILKEKLKK